MCFLLCIEVSTLADPREGAPTACAPLPGSSITVSSRSLRRPLNSWPIGYKYNPPPFENSWIHHDGVLPTPCCPYMERSDTLHDSGLPHAWLTISIHNARCQLSCDVIITSRCRERLDCLDTAFIPAQGDLAHGQNIVMESMEACFTSISKVLKTK